MANEKVSTIWNVIDEIRTAWNQNRMIVPLVGAGISADSGIPIVRSIVRYFGKFQQFVELQAYADTCDEHSQSELCKSLIKYRKEYSREPWKYVRDFGWPDRFQLNQDLLDFLREHEDRSPASVAEAAQLGIELSLQQSNPAGDWHLSQIKKDVVVAALTSFPGKDSAWAKEKYNLFLDHTSRNKGHTTEVRKDFCAMLARELYPTLSGEKLQNEARKDPHLMMIDAIISRFQSDKGSSVSFNVAGDWKRLIQYFTNYQGDYADALITRLCAGRGPSLGHQFLAYLCRLVGSKLILTYNFDDLIEKSFISQGIHPRVFGMEEGVRLPPETLVRDDVSILKLHGSNHALLLDERVDHPLREEYKHRFEDLIGKNPLLVVVGCSGNDMRVRDLVRHVMSDRDSPKAGVVWLHFEDEPPEFLKKWTARDSKSNEHSGRRVMTAQTNCPGADLMHIYTALSGRHPAAGEISYPVHLPYPSPIPGSGFDQRSNDYLKPEEWQTLEDLKYKAVILSTLRSKDGWNTWEAGKLPTRSASEALITVANRWLHRGFQVIWVDLESVNTIAGVAGTILDQCRAYDIQLAASVLPEDDNKAVLSAVRRISHALQRSRYLVVLDGLETFPWNPLTHHGETQLDLEGGPGKNGKGLESIKAVIQLFYRLAATEIGESKVWLGVDPPRLRNPTKTFDKEPLKSETIFNAIETPDDADEVAQLVKRNGWLKFHDICLPGCGSVASPFERSEGNALCTYERMNRIVADARLDDLRDFRHDALSSFILLTLSCFRRTRPFATLRHLLGSLFMGRDATHQLDELLNELSREPELGIIRMSGGAVWFSRTVRDHIYQLNSDLASTENMKRHLDKKNESLGAEQDYLDELKDTIKQLFFLTTTHQRISRSYHGRSFVQSRDCFAFLEYTYHRISSIRYLCKLIALVSEHGNNGQFEIVRKAFIECGKLLRNVLGVKPIDKRKRDKSPADKIKYRKYEELLARMEFNKNEEGVTKLLKRDEDDKESQEVKVSDVLKDLQERHSWEIICLRRGWERAQLELRKQLPAQQILRWSNQLVSDELLNRLNRVVTGYLAGSEPDFYTSGHRHKVITTDAVDPLNEFEQCIDTLRVRLTIDRTMYCDAIQAIESIDNKESQQKNRRTVTTDNNLNRNRCRRIHKWLDLAICHLREAQLRDDIFPQKSAVRGEVDYRKVCNEYLNKAKKDLPGIGSKKKYSSEFQEAWLRYYHIRADEGLKSPSVFSEGLDLDTYVTGCGAQDPIILAKQEVDNGMRDCRSQSSYQGRVPRSSVIERSADGTMYPPYRSVFYTLFGRLDWQRALREHPERFLEKDQHCTSNDVFEGVYRSFEMARGGLGKENRLLFSLNDIYFAEANLVHARVQMHRAYLNAATVIDPKGIAKIPVDEKHQEYMESLENGALMRQEAARYALQR
jgi:hypothetical protein